MTIGSDGYIRVWDFETVDTADITDESNVFEMEPMNELQVSGQYGACFSTSFRRGTIDSLVRFSADSKILCPTK